MSINYNNFIKISKKFIFNIIAFFKFLIYNYWCKYIMRMWRNGKRVRFRSLWEQSFAGSSPVIRTNSIETSFNLTFRMTVLTEICDAPLRSRYSVARTILLLTSPVIRTNSIETKFQSHLSYYKKTF